MRPTVRVIAGSPSQSILGNKCVYFGLGDLLDAHAQEVALETYQNPEDFLDALARDEGALATLVACHGYHLAAQLVELGWGQHRITVPLAAPIRSNAVVFNVC